MQTPRPDFRNAIRRISSGPDTAIYAILAVVLVFQTCPRVASVLGSAMAASFNSSSDRLVLKTAAYCDGLPSTRVSSESASSETETAETASAEEMPEIASNEFSMEKDADTPYAASRSIEESTGNSFLDHLQVGGFRLHSWLAAERRLINRLPTIVRADIERQPRNNGRTSGEGLMISWMDHDILRVERQKTRLSHAVTELTFSISLRTGDPNRPWAVFGIKAIGRTAQNELHAVRSVSEELVTHSLLLPEAWVAEVTVVSPLPAVLGGDDQESYSASWSAGSANPAAFYADECPMSAQSNDTQVA
jgi:hypothetical protein